MEFAASSHQTLDVSSTATGAIWSWFPTTVGFKLTFAAGLVVGLFLGCAGGALFRSYFMLFQLAVALGVLSLVWVI